MGRGLITAVVSFFTFVLPTSQALAGGSPWGALATNYSWGTYAVPASRVPNAHSGMAVHLQGGYRQTLDSFTPLGPGAGSIGFGLHGSFAAPDLSAARADDGASFQNVLLGAQVSYLWRGLVEPFFFYSPRATLVRSDLARNEAANGTRTEVSFKGQAFGAGLRAYLPSGEESGDLSAKIGFNFLFLREQYRQASYSTAVTGATMAGTSPIGTDLEQNKLLLQGNTYQVGLFIGL